ncbi:MAG: hypothetical protein Q9195_002516 [Heterodermia aff. obscurata]
MPNFPPPMRPQSPVDPPPIDTSSPDEARSSFRGTYYNDAVPLIRARFPNIDPLYLMKIFRGTITPRGLIWLDVDREEASPPDFPDLSHLLYCFEIYAQIICIFTRPQGMERELRLQMALADYRIRLLKVSKLATFESLNEWHKAVLEANFRDGQDRLDGWTEKREELAGILSRVRP